MQFVCVLLSTSMQRIRRHKNGIPKFFCLRRAFFSKKSSVKVGGPKTYLDPLLTGYDAAEAVSALSKTMQRAVGGKPKVPPMRKYHMGGAFTKNAAAVEVLLWIIYEGKKSAIDSSCASNGLGETILLCDSNILSVSCF